MLRLAPVLALALTACSGEPSFDERYTTAEKAIRDKAATMDAEMAEQGRLRGQATAPAPTSGGSAANQAGAITATR
jgi:hypothetical protein